MTTESLPPIVERITYIRRLLASGVTSSTVDGVSTSLNLGSLREELRRLEDEAGMRSKRPRCYSMNLRNT